MPKQKKKHFIPKITKSRDRMRKWRNIEENRERERERARLLQQIRNNSIEYKKREKYKKMKEQKENCKEKPLDHLSKHDCNTEENEKDQIVQQNISFIKYIENNAIEGISSERNGLLVKEIKDINRINVNKYSKSIRNTYVCILCRPKENFVNYDTFQTHLETHIAKKYPSCNHCGQRFKNFRNLKVHERCHRSEIPYACNICAEEFANSTNLRIHLRYHIGEQPCEWDFDENVY